MNYRVSPDRPLTTAASFFPAEEQIRLQAELGAILSDRLSMGPRVRRFEEEFASFCQVAGSVAFPSCTSALEAALQILGVTSQDEVLVPAETFVATGMAVHLVGAKPVVTEISGATFNMDFADALKRITPRTKGAIVVHFGGLISPEFPEFVEEMHRRSLFVIEDAAHAPGAELSGRRSGSFGDVGCFSFYPTKVMTTGEGGMLVSNREHLIRAARSLQSRGLDMDSTAERYIRPGRNNRFTEIAAALGLSQLSCLPAFLARRRAIARSYDERLGQDGFWRPLRPPPSCLSSCWRYVVIPEGPIDRVLLKQALAADQITIDWAYDPPLHLQPVFRQLFHTSPGMLPYSEALLSRHICLPMHARLLEQDAEYVLDRLKYHTALLARNR